MTKPRTADVVARIVGRTSVCVSEKTGPNHMALAIAGGMKKSRAPYDVGQNSVAIANGSCATAAIAGT